LKSIYDELCEKYNEEKEDNLKLLSSIEAMQDEIRT
jgi:hypothetical protein